MQTFAVKLLRTLTRPLVAFAARHSLKFQDISECLKEEFVRYAERELNSKNAKITDSRLSILTGLQRREITRIRNGGAIPRESSNIIFRVIGKWRDDSRFLTSGGEPRVLSLAPDSGEFQKLVSEISQDVGPTTVLFELERLQYVERTPRGLKLLVDNFIPRGVNRLEEGAEIFGEDAEDLAKLADHNLLSSPNEPLHHLRTVYDRVRPEGLSHLRNWFLKEGHDFHLRARAEISRFDQDVNPIADFRGNTARVSFSSFNFQEENSTSNDHPASSKSSTRGKKL